MARWSSWTWQRSMRSPAGSGERCQRGSERNRGCLSRRENVRWWEGNAPGEIRTPDALLILQRRVWGLTCSPEGNGPSGGTPWTAKSLSGSMTASVPSTPSSPPTSAANSGASTGTIIFRGCWSKPRSAATPRTCPRRCRSRPTPSSGFSPTPAGRTRRGKAHLQAYLAPRLSHPEAVWAVDSSGFLKQGKKSVGVAPQYCGAVGQVAHCQVGVFLAHVGPRGRALVDKRLFLPEEWTNHPARCDAAGIPKAE
jgi:hypothetical protein